MKSTLAAVLVSTVALTGCSGQAIKDLNRAPAMSPIGAGLNLAKTNELALYPKEPQQVATGYSLWSDQRSALFKDARALKIGDILTVKINIDDKASFDNETDRTKKNNRKTGWKANAKILGWSPQADSTLSFDNTSDSNGKGTISRAEKLTLLVAAVVTGILENGNLLISGSQEVRVNHEVRILNVAGIVRPQDVNSENTISYEKIAEARISYGGRGRITEIQQPPVGQQIADMFSPI